MIVTVTPNPSVDRTIEVDRLTPGGVHRARSVRVDAGGKGVNVSRALAANQHRTCAVIPSGGIEGAQLAALLNTEQVEVVLVAIHGAIRANVSVAEPDGTITKLNEPGPILSRTEQEAIVAATLGVADQASWVVASGSIPPGTAPQFYRSLIERLHDRHARIALDTSGAPLELALAAGPDVVKPNRPELAEAAGRSLCTLGDVVEAATLLREKGADAVLASLGPDGAVLVDASGAIHGEAPVRASRNAVGAGDAMLAGFLAAGGHGPAALAEALAWGAAATTLPGSRMPAAADISRRAVRVHDSIDLNRVLVGRS
jgi:1-phosphofructokinase